MPERVRQLKAAYMKLMLLIIFAVTALTAPVHAYALTSPSALKAAILSQCAVLMDADTGQILFDKYMHTRMYPASITKILTGLVALENGKLSDTITMSYDAVFSVGRNTSHIALDVDEQITLEQAMYALAIESANDAANGIAELIGGSMEQFAVMMNERAKKAGAKNSNFANAHGLPDEKHYTSAYDMAVIMREAVKNETFLNIFNAITYEVPPTNRQPDTRRFWSNNALQTGSYKYDGIIASKNGWTEDAGNTMVTAARIDGRTLIAVVLKSDAVNDKYKDIITLLDYGFDEFEKIEYTAEELSKKDYYYIDEDKKPATADLTAQNGISLLLHMDMKREDLELIYELKGGQAKVIVRKKPGRGDSSYTDLAELPLTAQIFRQEQATPQVEENTNEEQEESPLHVIIGAVLGSLLLLLIIIRSINKARARKRRRRRLNSRYRVNTRN